MPTSWSAPDRHSRRQASAAPRHVDGIWCAPVMYPEKHPLTPSNSPPGEATSTYKSRGGLARLMAATRYSMAGLKSALRHEAAFRQELAVGLPLLVVVPWLAPGRWQAAAMVASILFVFVVELLNSAIEAIADAVSVEHHPLLGRAKDLGSAAVLFSLLMAVAVWAIALWPQ